MLSRLRKFFRLCRDRRGTAALEFALIAGLFLVPVFYGVYDITEEVLFYQEVYNAAHSIAASASNLAAQANGSTSLNYTQIQFLESEIWGEIPSLRGDYQDGTRYVTISSIVFQPNFATTSTCAAAAVYPCYIPVVVWSVTYAGGDSHRAFVSTSGSSRHEVLFISTSTGAPTYGVSKTCGTGASATTNVGTTGSNYCFANIVGTNSGAGLVSSPNNPLRPCDGYNTSPSTSFHYVGSLNQTAYNAGNASDLTTLPMLSLSGASTTAPPSPILVVDVSAKFVPPIDIIKYGATTFYATAFWPVRSVQAVVTGTTTPLTLYNQFTSISESSVYNDTTQADVVSESQWCINEGLVGATVQ